jgi:hypothetical protein
MKMRLVARRVSHYDNSPSFSDFRLFGGWTRPAIKQNANQKFSYPLTRS